NGPCRRRSSDPHAPAPRRRGSGSRPRSRSARPSSLSFDLLPADAPHASGCPSAGRATHVESPSSLASMLRIARGFAAHIPRRPQAANPRPSGARVGSDRYRPMGTPRRIGFLAFPGLTLLDLIGVHDALRRLAPMGIAPEVTLRVIGTEGAIADEAGLHIIPDSVYEDLAPLDLLVVPGGLGTRRLLEDPRCIEYLRGWSGRKPLARVCTGSLLLGKAGLLAGLRATTHHVSLDLLRPFCREVVTDQRVVDEGRVVTAGGVTSALDLGLHLVGK